MEKRHCRSCGKLCSGHRCWKCHIKARRASPSKKRNSIRYYQRNKVMLDGI